MLRRMITSLGKWSPGAARSTGLLFALALAGCSAPPSHAGAPSSGNTAGEPGAGSMEPAPTALREPTWRLAEFAPGVPAPDAPPITLTFEEGRIAGSGGCNLYFGGVTFPAPGAIRMGAIGATKRGCPDPIMSAEQRYFDALRRATRYTLEEGRLTLSWEATEGAPPGPLRFVPEPAPALSEP